jgi:uncharacterized membrane protein SirB2
MDYATIKLTHYFFAVVFLLSYLIKTVLFFANRDAFATYKKKTMPAEILASVVFLAAGIYMLVSKGGFGGMAVWFHIKFTLVIIAIPLGIIGFKKENKLMIVLSTILFFFILGLALSKDPFLQMGPI